MHSVYRLVYRHGYLYVIRFGAGGEDLTFNHIVQMLVL